LLALRRLRLHNMVAVGTAEVAAEAVSMVAAVEGVISAAAGATLILVVAGVLPGVLVERDSAHFQGRVPEETEALARDRSA
jgi:hypothetical protein